MTPLHILMTVPSLGRDFGGPLAAATGLRAALQEMGIHVELIGVGAAPRATGLPLLAKFHATPVPATIRPLLRAVREADLVHAMGFRDPVSTAAAVSAARHRTPFVLEPVGMAPQRLRSLRLKRTFDATIGASVLKRASLVVATSAHEKAELLAIGIPEASVEVRPNGLDRSFFSDPPPRGRFRADHGIPDDATLVLTLARLNAIKGLNHLAAAIQQVPRAWCVIAGPDERDGTREVLERSATSLGGRLVIIPEGLWGERKRQALADADCLCLPSENESFGMAAAEGAAAGRPVIVSDRCGVSEWLDARATVHVPFGDPRSIARAIERVREDPTVARFAAISAPRVMDALDWHTVAARQLEIYDRARSMTR